MLALFCSVTYDINCSLGDVLSSSKPHQSRKSLGDIDLRRRQVVAEWVRVGMAEKGWKMPWLAKQSGVSRPAISDIINQKTNAKAETLGKLSHAFGKPPPAHLEITGFPPTIGTGPDPRTVRLRLAADHLILAANAAKQLPDDLNEAEQLLWRGIQAAERELRGDEKRRPRVTRAEVDRRKRAVDGSEE